MVKDKLMNRWTSEGQENDAGLFECRINLYLPLSGYSEKELADELGVSPAYISRICSGRVIPPGFRMILIAHLLGTTVDKIWILNLPLLDELSQLRQREAVLRKIIGPTIQKFNKRNQLTIDR